MASTSVSPGRLHPGPMSTVGAGASAVAPSRGNQWARIRVPSKDSTSRSEVEPGTRVETTGAAASGSHTGATADVVVSPAVASEVVVGDSAPSSVQPTTASRPITARHPAMRRREVISAAES